MAKDFAFSKDDLEYLLSPRAIRERCRRLFDFCCSGGSHFQFHEERLPSVVDLVLQTCQSNYPDFKIPFHSRWRHFRAGGKDRLKILNERLRDLDPKERARCKLDLVVTSVLLDAGAGTRWSFIDDGEPYSRSEGLGVASFYLFLSGIMSADAHSAQVDASALEKLSQRDLETAFQVTKENPLLGVSGRLSLMNNLAGALKNQSIFRAQRPGSLLDYLQEKYGVNLPASGILKAVLEGFGSIWPGRFSALGKNLGDTWLHTGLSEGGDFEGLVPFHKLSQWMTYSLIEPLEEAGFCVTGLEELTGLAEYRNGGLILDSGLVSLRDSANAGREWEPGSDLIIEWRALTIVLLDQIAERVREKLGLSASNFPLAKVLEGGTWWAGRSLAAKLRSDAGPPLKIKSDGTVF